MENSWPIVVEFTKAIAWPLVVLTTVILLRGFIEELTVKHNATELHLVSKDFESTKKDADKVVNKVREQLPKEAEAIQAQFDRLYQTAMAVVKDRAVEVESGSNSDGKHSLYSNGQAIQEILIPSGDLTGRKTYYLPSRMTEVSAVTFVGQESPKLVDVDSSRIEVELDHENESDIRIIISGVA